MKELMKSLDEYGNVLNIVSVQSSRINTTRLTLLVTVKLLLMAKKCLCKRRMFYFDAFDTQKKGKIQNAIFISQSTLWSFE